MELMTSIVPHGLWVGTHDFSVYKQEPQSVRILQGDQPGILTGTSACK